MDELLRRLAENNFADLEGLEVHGTIPVRQDIVNDILNTVVSDLKKEAKEDKKKDTEEDKKEEPANSAANKSPNWWKLVNKLQVRMVDGKLILDVELRR